MFRFQTIITASNTAQSEKVHYSYGAASYHDRHSGGPYYVSDLGLNALNANFTSSNSYFASIGHSGDNGNFTRRATHPADVNGNYSTPLDWPGTTSGVGYDDPNDSGSTLFVDPERYHFGQEIADTAYGGSGSYSSIGLVYPHKNGYRDKTTSLYNTGDIKIRLLVYPAYFRFNNTAQHVQAKVTLACQYKIKPIPST